MKKGFTLVELLAVVVILVVILAIAIPSITTVIENARINAYLQNEEIMIRATMNYVAINEEELPNETGETKEVTLKQLQTGEYISVIKDPNDKNEECNGYVLITKIDDNKYDYTPHLKCGDSRHIDSAEEDGLILHYKFNDFQEASKNIIYNPIFDGSIGNDRPIGWSRTGSGESYLTESSMFDNVQAWEMNVQSSDGPTDNRVRILSPTFNVQANTWYTVSVYIETFNYITGNFPVILINGVDIIEGETGLGISAIEELTNIPSYVENERYTFSFKAGSDSNGRIFIGSPHTSSNGTLRVSKVQVEAKPYATPFVDGEREGIVKDYSFKNNNAQLQLETTPRWIYDNDINSGIYKFNGIDNYIEFNIEDTNLSQTKTISIWVKAFSFNHYGGVIDNWGNGGLKFFVNSQGQYVAGFRQSGGTYKNAITPSTNLDTWYHFTVVFDNGNTNIYKDGNNVASNNGDNVITNNSRHRIGWNSDNSAFYNGLIDDVRVFNRALTTEEIQQLYDIESRKGR